MRKIKNDTEIIAVKNVFTIDCFKDGIEFGKASVTSADIRDELSLSLPDFSKNLVRRRHTTKSGQFEQLEKQLIKYSSNGTLKNSVIYLNTLSSTPLLMV